MSKDYQALQTIRVMAMDLLVEHQDQRAGVILEKANEIEIAMGILQAQLDQITKVMKELREDLYGG